MDRELILKLIEEGNESERVDFKREFYKPLKESDLPKDIAAFANSVSNEDKYIIFGVDDKTRQIVGIDANSFPNQDSLDEYLYSTVEPFIYTEIGCLTCSENVILGYIKVFAKNVNRPYVIKRTCGKNNNIQHGDIFIRKGAVIQKATRTDLQEMQKTNGTLLLKIHDDVVCIEPIERADPIVGKTVYAHCDIEIHNDKPNSVLLDYGEAIITTNTHNVRRSVVSILPSSRIKEKPLSLPAGSRDVYTCLFTFTSQDCVDFGFDSEGYMKEDVNIQIVLSDTDDNRYCSDVKSVMLKANGDILHKVRLKNKNEVIKVRKRYLF